MVTARFADGTAGVYNTVTEALDQASADQMLGTGDLQDVIDGGPYDDPFSVANPTIVATPADLATHYTTWSQANGEVGGRVMPVNLIDASGVY
jgi:hypothetical protein